MDWNHWTVHFGALHPTKHTLSSLSNLKIAWFKVKWGVKISKIMHDFILWARVIANHTIAFHPRPTLRTSPEFFHFSFVTKLAFKFWHQITASPVPPAHLPSPPPRPASVRFWYLFFVTKLVYKWLHEITYSTLFLGQRSPPLSSFPIVKWLLFQIFYSIFCKEKSFRNR